MLSFSSYTFDSYPDKRTRSLRAIIGDLSIVFAMPPGKELRKRPMSRLQSTCLIEMCQDARLCVGYQSDDKRWEKRKVCVLKKC